MTPSTPKKLRIPGLHPNAKKKPVNKDIKEAQPIDNTPKNVIKSRKSLGNRLLLLVTTVAFSGLGGLGYVFYQEQVNASQREIAQNLSSQVNALTSKLYPVQSSVNGLAASVKFFNRMGVKDANAYKQLVFEHFKNLEFALAIGVGQAPNQLVPDRKWYYPYFYREQKDVKVDQKVGERLPAPFNNSLYSDLFVGDNYPEKDYYKMPVAQGAGLWLEPYEFYGISMTTYIMPFSNDAGQLLGVTGADVNVTTLSERLLNQKAFADEGYFIILSNAGKILTYPPDPSKAKERADYSTIPELKEFWPKIQAQANGLVRFDNKYWSFRKVPDTGWLMVAVVPESVVLNRVLYITVGASAIVAILLTLVVGWFVTNLNRRLEPILNECDRLAEEKGGTLAFTANQDEIERLSVSFQNLIEQIAANEERIKEEVARAVQLQERSLQTKQTEEEAEALEVEIGGLLDVVSSLEEGDLTVQAEVSDRATGLVADTLNRLREQLAGIIAQVLGTAQRVARGAKDLEELAQTVARNTQEEAQSVAQGQALTEQVADLARNSVAQVSKANQALLTAQATVENGQGAINSLIEGISVLQKGTAQIVQRMKTLGEFVGLAEQFVQDQSQIASLTQVLAINATLVAARAAEQRDPKQFIGVAREFETIAAQVNSLATQTNEGLAVLQQRTSQIQSVVSAVDSEVQSLGGLVAGFNTGVDRSQEAFYSIRQVTEQVVELGQSVTETSFAIADAADSTAKYISEIATLAEQTAMLTNAARLQAESMGDLAERLLGGIQFFRLPAALLPEEDSQNLATSSAKETGVIQLSPIN